MSDIEVHRLIEVLDSEAVQIANVIGWMRLVSASSVNMESFNKEIVDRFAQIGFAVKVDWYSATSDGYNEIPGLYIPEVTIHGRTVALKEGFDYEKMRHEIVTDLAGLEPEKKGMTIPVPFTPDDMKAPTKHDHKH